jgi:uncharacterized RDD family membrane protein YckC
MTQIPSGWYSDPDPQGPSGRQRYWDGGQWTQHVHDPAPQPAATVQPPPYPSYPQGATGGTPFGQAAPYAQPVSSGPTTPDGVRISNWWRRVLAVIVDVVVQLPLYALAAVPAIVWQWDALSTWFSDLSDAIENDAADPPDPALFDPTTGPGFVLVLSLIVATTLYSVLFLRWKGATPGKLIVGLRVRLRETPGQLPWSTIARRVGFVTGLSVASQIPVFGFVFGLVALLDYLWPLWDGKNQALHDKVAGTNVVRPDRGVTATEAALPPRW